MWTEEQMKELLRTNKQAVLRAIIVLYNRQTELEKQFKESNVVNGMGYNCKDSWYMSTLAKQLIEYGKIANEDFWKARWRLRKYTKQLVEIANNKERIKEYIQRIHDILESKVKNSNP